MTFRCLVAVAVVLAVVVSLGEAEGLSRMRTHRSRSAPREMTLDPMSGKLTKPIIIKPSNQFMAPSSLALKQLASILSREPEVAKDDMASSKAALDDDEINPDDDSTLLGDDCSGLEFECATKKKDALQKAVEDALNPFHDKKGGKVGMSGSGSLGGAGAGGAGASGAGSGVNGGSGGFNSSFSSATKSVQDEISMLEELIKHAMMISKQIPEKAKRLQELKAQQEGLLEARAKAEGAKTLEQHKKLEEDIDAQITKLRAQLEELLKKKKQLETSDQRLKQELNLASSPLGGGESNSTSPSPTPNDAVGNNATNPISQQLQQLSESNPI